MATECGRHEEVHMYTVVFEGADESEKRGSTLDFLMKVIIVVCTLVKVYNIKKKTRLIVTAVSITSLYFKYILC